MAAPSQGDGKAFVWWRGSKAEPADGLWVGCSPPSLSGTELPKTQRWQLQQSLFLSHVQGAMWDVVMDPLQHSTASPHTAAQQLER